MTLLVLIHLLTAEMMRYIREKKCATKTFTGSDKIVDLFEETGHARRCLFVWLVVLMFHLQLVSVILHLFQLYVLNVSRK